jgi:DNA replication protein DnaC
MIDMLPDIHGLFTFFGGHGTGKSTAAMIVTVAAARAGVRSLYTTAPALALGVKDTWKDQDKSDQEYLDMINKNKVLVIDEIDRVGTYDQQILWNLVDMRYMDRDSLATILVTNMDITRAPKNMEYLVSRMRDGVRVPVYGEDMRHGV